MESNNRHNPEPEDGFQSFGSIFDALPGRLFDGVQIEPSKDEGAPENEPNKPRRKARQPSAKLVKAAAQISARPDKVEIAYLARHIVQCTLPRIDPGEKSVFVRRDGNVSLVMEARTDPETMKKRGLPSGSIAKVIWLWINTEAVYNKNSPDVENKYRLVLGKTFNEYILKLGLDPGTGGGKYSHAKSVKEELLKLLFCLFSFHQREGNNQKFVDMRIASAINLWWDDKSPNQEAFFESEIILDRNFFDAITMAPVPVDMRVVAALVRSPFAIDLYSWITYRIHTAKKAGHKEIKISIVALKQQFGDEYNRTDHFKAAVAKALLKIKSLCSSLDYTLDSKTLVLGTEKTQLSIAARGQKRRNPVLDTPNKISPTMREKFERRYPLHKVDDVFAEFDEWRTNKGIESRDTDAHFWDFVTNHYFQN